MEIQLKFEIKHSFLTHHNYDFYEFIDYVYSFKSLNPFYEIHKKFKLIIFKDNQND